MPCGSCGQRARRDAERLRQRVLRELPRAGAGHLGEDRREQVRAAGAVLHRACRLAHDRLPKRVAHPVAALHPCAIVAAARRLQPRPHRQQILDGDRLLPAIGIAAQLGEVRDDRLPHALDEAAFDRDADERGDDALGGGLDVGRRARTNAAGVVLGDELAAPAHEQAAQLRELRGGGAEVDDRGRSS